MIDAYICDAVRTPIGRYGGSLSDVRADDLAAVPIRALIERNPKLLPGGIGEVIYGCANQAGEDNRNVARMASLLAGVPESVPAVTLNRLCGSGLDAVGSASRGIQVGAFDLAIAGGVEAMTRAPFVIGKSSSPFGRGQRLEDTTMGWRFVNPVMRDRFGTDSMPQTAENVAVQLSISRHDQDAYSARSHERAAKARASGFLREEIVPVNLQSKRGRDNFTFEVDEHIRPDTTTDALSKLPALFEGGTVTAGNASGINDGAAALICASSAAAEQHGLVPRARILAMATAGVAPRVMGLGPLPAIKDLLARIRLTIDDFSVIEVNEAFAAQVLGVLRGLGLPDDCDRVNPNGGAIALGHPLGMSGARLVQTLTHQLVRTGGRFGLAAMCIGVGQGIAIAVERV